MKLQYLFDYFLPGNCKVNNIPSSASYFMSKILFFLKLRQSNIIDFPLPCTGTFPYIALIFNMDSDLTEFSPSQLELCVFFWLFIYMEKGLGADSPRFCLGQNYQLIWTWSGGLDCAWSQEFLLLDAYFCWMTANTQLQQTDENSHCLTSDRQVGYLYSIQREEIISFIWSSELTN